MNILKLPTKLCIYFYHLRYCINVKQYFQQFEFKLNIEKQMHVAITKLLPNFKGFLNNRGWGKVTFKLNIYEHFFFFYKNIRIFK